MDGDVSLESSRAHICTCLETLLVGKRGLVEGRESHGAIANRIYVNISDLGVCGWVKSWWCAAARLRWGKYHGLRCSRQLAFCFWIVALELVCVNMNKVSSPERREVHDADGQNSNHREDSGRTVSNMPTSASLKPSQGEIEHM